MFRPYKHTGGDYTDIGSMSTNIPYDDALLMSTFISTFISTSSGLFPSSTDEYRNIAESNKILIKEALDTPNKISTLTAQYQSTLSSISSQIVWLERDYESQYLSSLSTQTAKAASLILYNIAQSTLSTWDAYTSISSIYYSSMLNNLSTISTSLAPTISTLIGQSTMQVQENSTLTGIFNDRVATSTFNGNQISTNKGILELYTIRIIPSSISTLDSISSIYSTSIGRYNEEDLRISYLFSTYGPTFSSISTLNGNKKIIEDILQGTYQDYSEATTYIDIDNDITDYLDALRSDAATYSVYNSTITTMQQIESLYSLVMSGLSVPTQLVSSIGVQGGGAYTPTIRISSFTCDPNDSVCNAKLSYLQKYLTVYYSLSTAFISYESAYGAAHQARLSAEENTQARLTSTLQDILYRYDLALSNAQSTILVKTRIISQENSELSKLKTAYSSLTVDISTSLFTESEYAYLLANSGQQGGGTNTQAGTINVPINPYTEPEIDAKYTSSLSTYNQLVKIDRLTRAGLEQVYTSTFVELQKINNMNNYHHDTANNIENEIRALQPILDKNRLMLSSLQYTSSLISSAIVGYQEIQTNVGHAVQNAIGRSASILAPFEMSTIRLNDSLNEYYMSELNDYITTITQISTYVLFDTAKKQINDIDGPNNAISLSTMNSISQLVSFLRKSDYYIDALKSEQLYKSNYVQTKRVYELQEGYIASGIRKSDILPANDFNALKIDYDVFVEQVNNTIRARSTFNAEYVSSLSTILPILEVATQQELREPYPLTIPNIQIATTYLTGVNSNASIGSITSDPVTGNIYIYDYHTMVLQRVSNNLSQIINFASFTKPYISISAYNRIVYVIAWNSSMLYSVDSSQTVTQINTTVAGNNWLNLPKAISNVVNNKFYIINQGVRSIVCIDIGNNNAISMAASPGGAWGGINTDNFTQLLGIVVDSNNIGYAIDNDGTQIIKLNFQTNTSSVFAGTSTSGYRDGLGTSARFNATTNGTKVAGITIDSQNNLFLCDIQNNAIRKIDSEGNVTTYTNKSFVTGTRYTIGTNVPPYIINAPLLNTGINLNYINYLHGVCIVEDYIYTISNGRDTGTSGSDWIPNPTINTHIAVYPYFTETYPTSAVIYPYTMKYEYITKRTPLFKAYLEIPTTTLPSCPQSGLIDGSPQPTTTLSTLTTTLSPLQLGTLCRYIQITKSDNNIEILQVIAVDKRGKNVAFGANVSILPTTLETIGRRQYITNGTYVANSPIVNPPFIRASTKYLKTIDSTSALGSIASDPVSGNIYIYDLHKKCVQTVSSDLTQLGTPIYFQGGAGPYISITAYNRIVYAVDWSSSRLFSINFSVGSSPILTQINTHVAGNNWLNGPIAISNVVNNKFYITNPNVKSIISVDIANNYAIGMAASPGGAWGGINTDNFTKLLGIAVDSNNFGYVIDNGSRIIKLEFDTNTSSVFVGGTSTGYIDSVGTSARFNATDSNAVYAITIDSYNNLFLADIQNNAIRKIDTLTASVTTYTTLVNVVNAIYTLGSRVLPNVITTPVANTTISSNYLMNLYGLCIVNNKLYSVSNARDTGTTGSNWVPNPTNNTSIVSYTYRADGGILPASSYFTVSKQPIVNGNDILSSLDSSSSLGSITYDSSTGNIFIFDLHKMKILRFTTNLTSFNAYADFASYSSLSISAYNGTIYAVDFNTSTLFSVNSSGVKTVINTTLNENNLLYEPHSLSNVVNNKLYIVNRSKTIVSLNILDNTVATIASSSGTLSTASLPSFTENNPPSIIVGSDGIIYISILHSIYKLNPQTNSVQLFAGSTSFGYTDALGSAARFNNITAITIDSQNNLYVTDKFNKVIRRIDTEGNVTTHVFMSAASSTSVVINTPGVTFAPSITAAPSGNTNIQNTYMQNLRGICAINSNIYSISNARDTGYNSTTYVPNPTNNTSVTCYTNTNSAQGNSVAVSSPVTIEIDLGTMEEITAIRYIKKSTSYSPVGLTFNLLDSTRQQVTEAKEVLIDLGTTTFDLRRSSLTPAQRATAPLTIVPRRNGVCGIMGRYIKLLTPSTGYNYAISQISVITTDGTNLALGRPITAMIDNIVYYPVQILNGTYASLVESSSFVIASNSIKDFILIDLEDEYDITAVNIYYAKYTGVSNTIQNPGLLHILTQDMQIAANKTTSQYYRTIKKEILDFRRPLQTMSCPISVKWPPFYGTAGVIARYIRLKKVGRIAFSKLEVVDRTGLDVVQYRKVSVASGASSAQNGVSNKKGLSGSNMFSREMGDGYFSDVNNINQYFSVDFGSAKEICCINIYCCTDDINSSFMQGLTVSLYDADPDSSSVTPLITYTPIADGRLMQVFDTRYEPDNSEYPTSVTRTVSRYGSFGVYAQSIYVYGITIPTSFTIVDATGTSIIPVSSSGVNPRIYTLSRMYEITSIILNSVGTRVELYDCYSLIVGEATSAASTLDPSIIFADFRNLLNDSPNIYAPFKPYNLRRGGYKLSAFNSGAGTTYSSTGVKARYVKIIPKDPSIPLYISQIIAVDEFGINRAFQKQTFNVNIVGQPASLNFPPDGKNAVDGIYEAQIDNLEFIELYFTKYKRKFNNMSYVSYVAPASTSGPSQAAFGALQQMPYAFYIDLELDTTTDPSLMDSANRKEYSINSIIYVASKEGGAQSEGVIVQLLDDNLQVVGAQVVTNMVNIFGVDILDFRADTSVSMTSLPNRIEVRERIITLGPQNCGINTQYIRIEQTNPIYPLQISYVMVTDTTGYDVAMFKPTYSSSNIKESYSIVDGKRYLKNPVNAFTTSIEENQFVEINLEKEYELMSLSVGDVFGSSAGFSTLRVRLYNKDRDVIGSYASLVPANIKSALGYQATATDTIKNIPLDTSNFMYLSKIGVSIGDHLTAYKYQSGLLSVAAVQAYSTITTLPSLLTPLSGSGSCSTQIILTQQYRRVNGGIPTRYVRLYNVGNYIQVSQIMVYDTTGRNVAYRASTYATSTLPNRYAAYATDGYGGFFHRPRNETNCFISGNLSYDYLEIDLGAVYNIVAVRYIPPTTNLSRNIGVRVQLRGYNSITLTTVPNSPIVTLAEMVVTTLGDTILDYRVYTPNVPPIDKVISPRITTSLNILDTNNTITGFCIKQDNIKWNPTIPVDTYYYVDPSIKTMRAIYINSSGTRSYATGSQINYYTTNNTPSNMMGVYYSPSYLKYMYIADYTANKVYQIKIASDEAYNDVRAGEMFHITTVINPYSLTGYNNMLYICENRIGGNIYSFNEAPFNGTLTPIYTNKDYMASITVNSAGELLVCVGSTKEVIRISTSGTLLSVFAAPSGTADNIIPLENPSGIAVDTVNNVVFISDVQTNIIYAVTPSGWRVLAGTGSPGYTGDGAQSAFATLDGPFFLQYYNDALYIADKNNKCIRKIDLQSGPSASILSTTTNFRPEGFITTTIPGTSATGTTPTSTAIIRPQETYDTYIKNINLPIISQLYDGVGETSSLHIDQALGVMFMHTGLRLYKSERSSNFMNFSQLFNANNDTIGFVKSMTSDTSLLYLASINKYKIFSVNINTINVSLVCGNGQARYSPDDTLATLASIMPNAVHYNTLNNSLYFIDCQATCGLLRRIDSFGKIQTVAGLYSPTVKHIDPTTYYTNILDNVKPETNPLAVYLSNPCSIATDAYGNIYIADSGTHCIHRLTPTGLLQPVCGPFRTTSTPISFFNEIATDMDYPAYSVKINTPSSLTFDLDMNLYCTSLNGSQIVKISKLNDNVEPEVRVISGLGVDMNSSGAYLSGEHTAKYSFLRFPTNIIYSYDTNSLYFKNQQYIRRITLTYNDILYKGNNLVLPYGIVNDIWEFTHPQACNFMTMTHNNHLYFSDTENHDIRRLVIDDAATVVTTVLYDPNTTPKDMCIYIDQYIYLTDSENKKIKRLRISNNALDTIYTDTDIPNYLRVHNNGCIFVAYENYIKIGNVKNTTLQLTNISIDPIYSNFGPIELDDINNKLYISVKQNSNTLKRNTILQYNINFTYTPTLSTTLSIPLLSTTTLQNIVCDYGGNIYFSDSTNVYYIQKDSTNLVTLYTGVLNPKCIYYFENKIYVADTGNNRYIILNSNAPSTPTIDILNFQLSIPSGIYVNISNMYITDKGNNLIRIKNRSTGDWTSIPVSSPVGIVADSNNIIYYSSSNYIYKIIGTTATVFSTLENNIGQLSIDSANNIYTTDLQGYIYKITSVGITSVIKQIPDLKGFSISENKNDSAIFDTKYYYITQSSCRFFMITHAVSLSSNPNIWTIDTVNADINSFGIYANTVYCSASNNIIYKLDVGINPIRICGPDSDPISVFPSPSLRTNLTNVKSFAFTNNGTMIIADANKFLRLNAKQIMDSRKLYTIAGFPERSSNSGDGQLASLAYLNNPGGTCFDKAGNIFIADTGNNAVRRIDVLTGIITTVVSNVMNVIDVQVDNTGALYALTPTKLYRSTLNSSNTYNSATVFAGEGLTIINNGPALACKIENARSIRLDSRGNIYIVSSNPITATLNSEILAANSSSITFLNSALYGISSSSEIVPTPTVTSGSLHANQQNLNSLYGVGGTYSNPIDGSLLHTKNRDFQNYANENALARKLTSLRSIIITEMNSWSSIKQIIQSTLTARESNYTNIPSNVLILPVEAGTDTRFFPPSVSQQIINGQSTLITLLSGVDTHFFPTYSGTGIIRFNRYAIRGYNETDTQNGLFKYILNTINAGYRTVDLIFLKNALNTLFGTVGSASSPNIDSIPLVVDITTAKQNAEANASSAWTSYMGNFAWGVPATSGSNYQYETKYIQTYGSLNASINAPTGGTQLTYNNQYSALQAALRVDISSISPTAAQLTAATANASFRIQKIDLYGIIKTYVNSSDKTLVEPIGIAFDSSDNLYIVDHYTRDLFMIPSTTTSIDITSALYNNYCVTRFSYRPYGIAIDNNKETSSENNIYVSFNGNDTSYNCNGCVQHQIHVLNRPASSSIPLMPTGIVQSESAVPFGSTAPAVSPYLNFYGTIRSAAIKNPQLLSIDNNNRLIFTQSRLHNVIISPLNAYDGSIRKIKKIRLEPASPGKRVAIKKISPIVYKEQSITIEGINPTYYTISASSNSLAATTDRFPIYTLNSDTNPFIEISFPEPIYTALITFKAERDQIDAVGMKVLLFDNAGNLVSNRVTTHKILDQIVGCEIFYNTYNLSNS